MNLLIPFLIVALLSSLGSYIIIRWSQKIPKFIRQPTNNRWHVRSTPSFGGIVIFLSFGFSQVFLKDVPGFSKIDCLFLASIPAFVLGLIDDLKPLPPYIKLIGQITSACLLLLLNVHVAYNGNPIIFIPLTIGWVVAMTNAFNLLDNMDGLAGGIAIIAAVSLLCTGFVHEAFVPPHVLIYFIASIFGFFIFNYPPAKIFMGDCGSQWIGFMLAGFSIIDSWTSASNLFLMLMTPALIFAIPIFDTILVTFNRKLHGRPISQGGKDHSSHRFVALGYSETKTVFVLWGLATVYGLLAVFANIYQIHTWAVLVGMGTVFVFILGFFLTEVRVYEPSEESIKKNKSSRFQIMHKRRFIEILFDTAMISAAYYLSYLVRFDWVLDSYQQELISRTLPIVVGVKLITFFLSGLYQGIWMYIDFHGFSKLLRSLLLSSITTVVSILFLYRFEGFSRTLFFIDFCILFILMGGSRALLRGLRESVFAFPDQGTRVLVLGAGEAGKKLLSEIRKNRQWNLTPIAILDDDKRKKGGNLIGIPVIGPLDDLEDWIEKKNIERVIVAIPSIAQEKKSEIEQRCILKNVPVVSMPSMEETIIQRLNIAI